MKRIAVYNFHKLLYLPKPMNPLQYLETNVSSSLRHITLPSKFRSPRCHTPRSFKTKNDISNFHFSHVCYLSCPDLITTLVEKNKS
jgi:hypothetical protein